MPPIYGIILNKAVEKTIDISKDPQFLAFVRSQNELGEKEGVGLVVMAKQMIFIPIPANECTALGQL